MHHRSCYMHHLSSTASESQSVTQRLIIFFSEDELIFTITGPDGDRGSTVVKVLCHKLEGRWFDSAYNEEASRKAVGACCNVYVAGCRESCS